MYLFKPQEVFEQKLLKNTPNFMKIYAMLRDGRLGSLNIGSEKRGIFLISKEDIDVYNAQF